jgi:hypothetical protein
MRSLTKARKIMDHHQAMDDDIATGDAIDQLKQAWAARDVDRVQGLLELLTSRLAHMYAANKWESPTAAIDPG